ncbi:pentapeptide repeat-containing protein [Acaryochloris marina NIES-2412]|uniref:pentapeptide repeat-containing protein n=1 Tax=Acaryochloris marina TaxID=155978 RepID=UPI0040581287
MANQKNEGNAKPNPDELSQTNLEDPKSPKTEKIEPYKRENFFCSLLLDENKREAAKVVISIFGVLTTVLAAIGLIRTVEDSRENRKLVQQQLTQDRKQFDENQALIQQRLITDRFSKSATLLSDDDKAVRIAAIFALERIAKDSSIDHWTIMELLSVYVLEKSPLSNNKEKVNAISSDVQAALTVIGRRIVERDEGKTIDLSARYLQRANLIGANFKSATLFGANLRFANLNSANLSGANLSNTNASSSEFIGAKLISANLNTTELNRAKLSDADFSNADLSNAKLRKADLSNAILTNAKLADADLSGAILLNTNLLETKLIQAQLEGKEPPLICNSQLPQNWKISRDRDCDNIPSALYKTFPKDFPTLENAQKTVEEQRQKHWN